MAEARGVELDTQSLPEGAVRLVRLATAVPPRTRERTDAPAPLLDRIGKATLAWRDGAEDAVIFLGETTIAFWRLLTGRANVRGQDFWLGVQQSGAERAADRQPDQLAGRHDPGLRRRLAARPVRRRRSTSPTWSRSPWLREMGPMMAAMIMAGRTGAAYAAQLGTMQVNEEIDALRGMGISPMEFLVLPRMLALALMMPLLAIYANLFGMLGGAVVGVGVLGISPVTYYEQSLQFIRLQRLRRSASDQGGGVRRPGRPWPAACAASIGPRRRRGRRRRPPRPWSPASWS